MPKYYHSDYALNKKTDSIVYQQADGSLVEITMEDYLSQNPHLTQEQFYELKEISDEMFKVEKNTDRTQERTKTKEVKKIKASLPPVTQDERLIENEEIAKIRDVTNKLLESGKLSPTQERRFIAHYCQGKSYRQIAMCESVDYTSVRDSIKWARKKLKKLFEE